MIEGCLQLIRHIRSQRAVLLQLDQLADGVIQGNHIQHVDPTKCASRSSIKDLLQSMEKKRRHVAQHTPAFIGRPAAAPCLISLKQEGMEHVVEQTRLAMKNHPKLDPPEAQPNPFHQFAPAVPMTDLLIGRYAVLAPIRRTQVWTCMDLLLLKKRTLWITSQENLESNIMALQLIPKKFLRPLDVVTLPSHLPLEGKTGLICEYFDGCTLEERHLVCTPIEIAIQNKRIKKMIADETLSPYASFLPKKTSRFLFSKGTFRIAIGPSEEDGDMDTFRNMLKNMSLGHGRW